jgi:hypothetical protein
VQASKLLMFHQPVLLHRLFCWLPRWLSVFIICIHGSALAYMELTSWREWARSLLAVDPCSRAGSAERPGEVSHVFGMPQSILLSNSSLRSGGRGILHSILRGERYDSFCIARERESWAREGSSGLITQEKAQTGSWLLLVQDRLDWNQE